MHFLFLANTFQGVLGMNIKTRRDEERKRIMMSKKSSQDMGPGNYQGLSKKDRKNDGKGIGQRTKAKNSPY